MAYYAARTCAICLRPISITSRGLGRACDAEHAGGLPKDQWPEWLRFLVRDWHREEAAEARWRSRQVSLDQLQEDGDH